MAPAAPLFILGAPRSGTSLLYKLLCLHPEAAWISNWLRKAPGVPALSVLDRAPGWFPSTRRRVWFGADGDNAYVYGRSRRLADRLFPMPVEGEPVYRRCGVSEGPADPSGPDPVQVDGLRQAFAAVGRWAGRSVLVSKRIANNQRIPLLAAAFPDASFVHLVRDGRAVAASLERVDWWDSGTVWWYGGTPAQWRDAGGDPWELAARHWTEELACIDTGLAVVPAGRRLTLSYERLIADPLATVRQVAGLAGLPPDAAWSAELGRLRYPDRSDAWRARIEPAAAALVEAIQRDDLRRLGYLG